MKKLVITLLLIVVVLGAASLSGLGARIFIKTYAYFNQPQGPRDGSDAAPAPDYNDPVNWSALPTTADPADLVPEGISAALQGELPVDVFFIHPTGFLTSGSWTSPMDPDSGTEENTKWMMANQASAYNGCCNVYAPRYREANIFAYFGAVEDREKVLGFAYQDVARAFEYYLDNYNAGRPFLIAAHSQGTVIAMASLLAVPDAQVPAPPSVALVTYGSPISHLYERLFPSYFSREAVTQLRTRFGGEERCQIGRAHV